VEAVVWIIICIETVCPVDREILFVDSEIVGQLVLQLTPPIELDSVMVPAYPFNDAILICEEPEPCERVKLDGLLDMLKS
jgi:hypothetical protein